MLVLDDSSGVDRGADSLLGQKEFAQYYIDNSVLDSSNINLGLYIHSRTARKISDLSTDRVRIFID